METASSHSPASSLPGGPLSDHGRAGEAQLAAGMLPSPGNSSSSRTRLQTRQRKLRQQAGYRFEMTLLSSTHPPTSALPHARFRQVDRCATLRTSSIPTLLYPRSFKEVPFGIPLIGCEVSANPLAAARITSSVMYQPYWFHERQDLRGSNAIVPLWLERKKEKEERRKMRGSSEPNSLRQCLSS